MRASGKQDRDEDRGSGLPDAEACAPKTTWPSFLHLASVDSLLFLSPSPLMRSLPIPEHTQSLSPRKSPLTRSPGHGSSQNSTVLISPHLTAGRICSIRFSYGPGCCRWGWWRWGASSESPTLGKSNRVEEGLCELEAPHKLFSSSC